MEKNKAVIVMMLILMSVVSCFTYPIIYWNFEISLYIAILMLLVRIQMIYLCVKLGEFLRRLYRDEYLKTFLMFFATNALGLIYRVILEWGEVSMQKMLTPLNILVHLVFIPTLIVLGSYTSLIKKRRN